MCCLEDLTDPPSKSFILKFEDGEEVEIFVVRSGEEAHAYINECPHQAVRLNCHNDQFLTADGRRILCGMHGATFHLKTGEALSGPALPDGCLMKVPVSVVGGLIRLAPRG
jgi:nitrite reductase/ring-hydroxylating ferredoxin subunit